MIETTPQADPRERPVGLWLLVLAAMVVAMVLLGGATRLTESGLSMVAWEPVTGWLPPLSDAGWEEAFAAYRAYPEYRLVNHGMTLAEFQQIFWLEYAHRLWGRMIGVAFLAPFLWFLGRGRIRGRRVPQLVALFGLGALQGAVGWWMVASGLVDMPDVSHLRLAVHLGLAVAILVALLWVALDVLAPRTRRRPPGAGWLAVLAALVFAQILSGALVAGLNAGLIYNTFPTMNGDWIPWDAYAMQPLHYDVLWNAATVQLHHRLGAYLVVLATIATLWRLGRLPGTLSPAARRGTAAMGAALVVQVGLGIATLLLQVPVWLGVLHQAGALALLLAIVFSLHAVLRPAGFGAAAVEERHEPVRPALRDLS
jgi:cytochrome c oxidase assembly protein subunit 15